MQKITNDIAINIDHLYTIYNKKSEVPFVAIKNFSYTFKKKRIYCIIGESGSGKSTLINSFIVLNPPDYGSILINQSLVEAKKRLENVIINKINVDTKLLEKYKDKYQYHHVVQTALNSKKLDIKLFLNALIESNEFAFKRINKKILKLSYNIKNNFYVVSSNDTLSAIKTIDITKVVNEDYSCVANKKAKRKVKEFKEIRSQIGMVYQFPEFQLFKPTVLTDVAFGPIHLGIKKPLAESQSIVALEKLGINSTFYQSSPFGLSGGQKRRVALAGIFAINPSMLVFDEPTAGLDPEGEKEMINIMLKEKQNDKTVFVVTHSMNQVLEIADEVLVLHNGKLVKAGEPYEIFLDESILKRSRIELPLVIQTIKGLIKKNKKFNILLKYKPRNVEELAKYVVKIQKGNKND